MGTRLYPNATTPAALEQLCGVRPGTHARMVFLQEAAKAAWPAGYTATNGDDAGYLAYKLLELDPEVAELKDFILYGWGRVTFPTGWPEDQKVAGGTVAKEEIIEFLELNDVPVDLVDLTEGLHWV